MALGNKNLQWAEKTMWKKSIKLKWFDYVIFIELFEFDWWPFRRNDLRTRELLYTLHTTNYAFCIIIIIKLIGLEAIFIHHGIFKCNGWLAVSAQYSIDKLQSLINWWTAFFLYLVTNRPIVGLFTSLDI